VEKKEAYKIFVGNPLRKERRLEWRGILKRLFSDPGENVVCFSAIIQKYLQIFL